MIDIALIEKCAINVAPSTIAKIIQVESGGNYLALNVNKLKAKQPHAKTVEEAVFLTKTYIAKGYSVDVGLMQINSANFKKYGINGNNLYKLFNRCENIKIGADILYKAYNISPQTINSQKRLQHALSIYNTGNKSGGFTNGYVYKYYKQIKPPITTSIKFNASDFYNKAKE